MKYFNTVFNVMLLFSATLLHGQENIDTLKTHQLSEVIVTAQYNPQTIEKSVYKIKVIDAGQIRSKGANNLRELLYHELNIDLEQRSVFGTSVEIQGISKENIKILVDGVPLIGRLNGIIDLSQINLDNIERVEIIEGPTSVFYGTDAMAGTINLISKQKQNKTFSGNLASYFESIGVLKLNAGVGYLKGNSKVRLSGGHYSFGGYSPDENDLRNREWESRKQYFGKLQFSQWINSLKLSYSGDIFTEKLEKLGEADTNNVAKDILYNTRRINNSLNLSGSVAGDHYLDFTAAYSDYLRFNNAYLTDTSTDEQSLSTKSSDHDTTRYNLAFFRGQFSSNKKDAIVNYAIGSEFNYETTEGKRILDGDQSIQTFAVFASGNFRLWEQLNLQPGFRYTYNEQYGNLLTPAFNLKLDVGKNSRLLASYARGFRAPSLKELYLDFYLPAGPFTYHISGNPDLEPEKSHNFSLSFYNETNFGNKQKLTIEPSLFYNDIDNLIALSALIDFERNYINVNKHKTHGGKLEISYQPIPQLIAKAGYALIGRYNSFSDELNTDLKSYLYTNNLNTEVTYCFTKQDLSFSLYYKFVGERPGYAIEKGTGDLIETRIASNNILDFTLNKSFLKNKLRLNGGIKNILDVKNLDTVRTQSGEAHATDSFLWGRTWFARLEWRF